MSRFFENRININPELLPPFEHGLVIISGTKQSEPMRLDSMVKALKLMTSKHLRKYVRVRCIYASNNLFYDWTVKKNIKASFHIFGRLAKGRRIKEMMEKLGLSHLYHKEASKLSLLEEMKLSFACSLMNGCEAIIIEEPDYLSEPEKTSFYLMLKRFARDRLIICGGKGKTASDIADRNIIFDGEKIISDETTSNTPAASFPDEEKVKSGKKVGASLVFRLGYFFKGMRGDLARKIILLVTFSCAITGLVITAASAFLYMNMSSKMAMDLAHNNEFVTIGSNKKLEYIDAPYSFETTMPRRIAYLRLMIAAPK